MHAHVLYIGRYIVCSRSCYGSMRLLTFRLDFMHLMLAFCGRKTLSVFNLFTNRIRSPMDTPNIASTHHIKNYLIILQVSMLNGSITLC